MTEKRTIAEKIRAIRKACGFTQQQVAAVLNVDRSTYTYYETGKTTPDIHTVKLLANLFNLSIDDLLADEGAENQMNDSASPEESMQGRRASARNSQQAHPHRTRTPAVLPRASDSGAGQDDEHSARSGQRSRRKIKNSQPAENQPAFLLHCLYSGQAFQL